MLLVSREHVVTSKWSRLPRFLWQVLAVVIWVALLAGAVLLMVQIWPDAKEKLLLTVGTSAVIAGLLMVPFGAVAFQYRRRRPSVGVLCVDHPRLARSPAHPRQPRYNYDPSSPRQQRYNNCDPSSPRQQRFYDPSFPSSFA